MIFMKPPDSMTWRFRRASVSRNSSHEIVSIRSLRPLVNWIPSVPRTRPGLRPFLRAFSIAASTEIASMTMKFPLRGAYATAPYLRLFSSATAASRLGYVARAADR